MKTVEKDFLQGQVHDQEVFFECFRPGDELPPLIQDHRAAVEDQFILSSHQVDIGHEGRIVPSPRRKHPLAKIPLPRMKRGRRDIHDERGASLETLGSSRIPRVPDIFTDVHPDHRPLRFENHKLLPPLEIPILIKDPVVGEVNFVIDSGQFAILENGGGIVDIVLHIGKPDDGGDIPGGLGHLLQSLQVILDKGAIQQEVFGRITRQGQLREGHQIGPPFPGLFDSLDDFPGIPPQISHGDVHLGEGQTKTFAHGFNPFPLWSVTRCGGTRGPRQFHCLEG